MSACTLIQVTPIKFTLSGQPSGLSEKVDLICQNVFLETDSVLHLIKQAIQLSAIEIITYCHVLYSALQH